VVYTEGMNRQLHKMSWIILISLTSCIKPPAEVALDYNSARERQVIIMALVEAQIAREFMASEETFEQARASKMAFAKQFEQQVLNTLNAEEQRLYRAEMAQQRRQQLMSVAKNSRPGVIAFYQDLPPIKGITTDSANASHMFIVELVLGYDLKNRRLGLDIHSNRLVIVDRLRQMLMQYPPSNFMWGREEQLRQPMMDVINSILTTGSIITLYMPHIEIHEIP
jgi:flagellar basal body-associated protein FliL